MKMKTFMLWHGGAGYACSDYNDIESFESLDEALHAFRSRLNDSYYPCVETATPEEGGPCAWLWFHEKPADDGDLYPDRVIELGPRGGLNQYPG